MGALIKLDLNDVEEDIILYISLDSIKPVCYSLLNHYFITMH
jgi:hypothetical protein